MANNKFRYTNEQCPVCNEHFKNDDDIAVCPYCGTPHHRECYKANSDCANHHKHNDGFKWEPTFVYQEDTQPPAPTSEETFQSGQPNDINQTPFGMPFMANPLASFPPELEEGVKTEDVAIFVRQDAIKYIGKFQQIKNGKKTWNWAAFFFAPYWFFYRKLYKLGAIILAVLLLLSAISFLPPAVRFANTVYDYEAKLEELSESIETDAEYQSAMTELSADMRTIFEENSTGIALIVFQSTASLAVSIFIGLNANKWYYKHTISQIKKIKSENKNGDYKPLLFASGGISFGAAFLSVLAEKAIIFALEMILPAILH